MKKYDKKKCSKIRFRDTIIIIALRLKYETITFTIPREAVPPGTSVS